jgi:ribosome maturation factor RimP
MRPEELLAMIEPVLEQLGIELVELLIHGKGHRTIVRILVDEVGGINIDRITQASRAIADRLDQTDAIPTRYTLEVSSPGADRPLKTERDFVRHTGRKVKIQYDRNESMETLIGIIVGATGDQVRLQRNNETEILEIGRIKSAIIVFEF